MDNILKSKILILNWQGRMLKRLHISKCIQSLGLTDICSLTQKKLQIFIYPKDEIFSSTSYLLEELMYEDEIVVRELKNELLSKSHYETQRKQKKFEEGNCWNLRDSDLLIQVINISAWTYKIQIQNSAANKTLNCNKVRT